MVAVNAGLILAGPELSPSHPYLKGAPQMYDEGVLVAVKLKFLVDAHISIFESPDAYGRYLCFNRTICRPDDAVELAQMLSPGPTPPPRYIYIGILLSVRVEKVCDLVQFLAVLKICFCDAVMG